MSSTLGSQTQVGYMQLEGLGAVSITLNPKAGSPNVLHVDVGCNNRMEVLHMETNPGETVDQFCQRLRGMMRALWQSQPMPEKAQEKDDPNKPILSGLAKLKKQLGGR